MPRIAADNIVAHVAQQRAAVLDASIRLFTTRGYTEVTLADIAAEVGLARSSLYRYVPDKVHLLVEWYRAAVPRITAEWEEAVSGGDPAPERLKRWAVTYLTWTATPEYQLVAPLTEARPTLDEATRTEVGELHHAMMGVVARTVADAGIPDDQVAGTVGLLTGLALGAARADGPGGRLDPAILARLDAAIDAILRGIDIA